jgi:hypothetical protein
MKHQLEIGRQARLGGAFLLQLRSDSAVEAQRISGRIEHHLSGDSQPFSSLEAMLSFMARHCGGGRNSEAGAASWPPPQGKES